MPDSKTSLEIRVTHQSFPLAGEAIKELKPLWLELQQKADTHFFLSWKWIASWLRMSPHSLLVVKATRQAQVVGVGLFTQRTINKFGVWTKKQLWLNRCGDDRLDQIWVEYNDCLLAKECQADARQAIYDHIFARPELCDELYVGLSLPPAIPEFDRRSIGGHQTMISQGFGKTIAARSRAELFSDFSTNTRKQIKRSIKLLEREGNLAVRAAHDQQEAGEWFDVMAKLHQKKWRDSAWGSGFDNPDFVRFHRQLLNKDSANAELLALIVDNYPQCFLYNLIDGNSVYFYLSAIPQQSDNRIKLGLVAHTLAMEYYSERGLSHYDFLAGTSRYKQSLSDRSYDMVFYRLVRHSLVYRLESVLRSCKKALRM